MSKFNQIHKSQTWAFIDGVLVGLQIGICLTYGYLNLRAMKPIETEDDTVLPREYQDGTV